MNVSILHHSAFLSLLAVTTAACSGGTLDDGSGGSAPSVGGNTSGGSASGGSASGGMSSTGGTPGAGGGASYCDASPLLELECSGPACHGSPGSPARFYVDFFNPPTGQTVGQSLIGLPAEAVDSTCPPANDVIIDASNAANSLILKKVVGTHTCGGKMPDEAGLPQTDVDCLTDWVTGVVANGM